MDFLWEGEHLGVSDRLEKSEWSEGKFQARWVKFRCGMTSGATAGLK